MFTYLCDVYDVGEMDLMQAPDFAAFNFFFFFFFKEVFEKVPTAIICMFVTTFLREQNTGTVLFCNLVLLGVCER